MLVLTRKAGQSIKIGDNIEIKISRVEGDVVKVGIAAPRSVKIYRKEVLADIATTNEAAAVKGASPGGLPQLPQLPRITRRAS